MDQHHMLPRPGERQHESAKRDLLKPPADASMPPAYTPPSYHAQAKDPSLLKFSDAPPSAELPPILPAAGQDEKTPDKLPSLSSLASPPASRPPIPATPPVPVDADASETAEASSSRPQPKPKPTVTHWPSMNPLTTFYTPSHVEEAQEQPSSKMDVDAVSNSNSNPNSVASPGYDSRGPSVSLDDPEVRLAAEALGDLRADFVSSPPSRATPLPPGSPAHSIASRSIRGSQTPQQEPLFSLLTTAHPFLATTIEGATSAYNSSKNISPRFKTSVEYVEGYLTPIANTVGSVGRVTGVEGGVRWFLNNGRRPSDIEGADGGSNKRRRVDKGGRDEMVGVIVDPTSILAATDGDPSRDSFVFRHDRRLSRASTIDTLPAYDDIRSPAYTENDKQNTERPESSASVRQSRLAMSTSGLTVAMSNESLRSLKYCLHWLRWANEHIGGTASNLKTTLDKYEQAGVPVSEVSAENAAGDGEMEVDPNASEAHPREGQSVLAERIMVLKGDILKSLQHAIVTVSKHAGSALPENARVLVHRHLTTLPQRFRYAAMIERQQQQQQQQGGDDGTQRPPDELTREGANRVLVLAKEGLDMIGQVSGVIDGTIISAEEWCDKLGYNKAENSSLPTVDPKAA